MVFSFSVLRYDLSNIIELTDETELIIEYRTYIRHWTENRIINFYEWLITLSKEQLSILRLEFKPKSYVYSQSICIKVNDSNINNKYLIFKDDEHGQVFYGWEHY